MFWGLGVGEANHFKFAAHWVLLQSPLSLRSALAFQLVVFWFSVELVWRKWHFPVVQDLLLSISESSELSH